MAGLVTVTSLPASPLAIPRRSSSQPAAAAAALGIVTARRSPTPHSGSSTLALNPPLTHAYDKSTIPYYNIYFSDTWHMNRRSPSSYGMGWTLEMPPTEASGKQTVLVDAADKPIQDARLPRPEKSRGTEGPGL